MVIRHSFLLALALPLHASAEKTQPSYIPPPSTISTDAMLQMVIGLLLVLAVIGAIAWLLKRFAIIPSTATGVMKVIATTGVGQRERVVIVEVDNTWLVLGVAPGRVNMLHHMDKSSLDKAANTLKNLSADNFPEQLNKSMGKTHD